MASAVATSFIGVLCAFGWVAWTPVTDKIRIFGVRRSMSNIHGESLRVIPNSMQCEDLHHHAPSNLLFAACQTGAREDRFSWFPGLALLEDPSKAHGGSLAVLDPSTFSLTHLTLEDFPHPFVTHGFDIYTPPSEPENVYIFAINHLPNPDHFSSTPPASPDRAASQIELFRHTLGSTSATHLRTIRHPLIRTPNDVLATSKSTFYVTNDHYYREGRMRGLEDMLDQRFAPWTDTIHVSLSDDLSTPPDATVAVTGLHNNNGLGRASSHRPDEVLVVDCTGGVLLRMRRNLTLSETSTPHLRGIEPIFLHSTLDNPSWFEDTYATPSNNASGYVLAGLAKALDIGNALETKGPIASLVWHVRADSNATDPRHDSWEKRLIFQDSGEVVNGAATAVMLGIDPAVNEGKKQAWLFVTGFLTDGIVATKIDL